MGDRSCEFEGITKQVEDTCNISPHTCSRDTEVFVQYDKTKRVSEVKLRFWGEGSRSIRMLLRRSSPSGNTTAASQRDEQQQREHSAVIATIPPAIFCRKAAQAVRETMNQQETARETERQHEAVKLPRTIFTRDVIAQSPVTYKTYTATGNYAPRFTPLADDKWGAAWPDSIDLSDSLLITTFRHSK